MWPSKINIHVSSKDLKVKHREVLTSRAQDPCVFDHRDRWVFARNSYHCYMLENIALRNLAQVLVKKFLWSSLIVYIYGKMFSRPMCLRDRCVFKTDVSIRRMCLQDGCVFKLYLPRYMLNNLCGPQSSSVMCLQ